MKKPINLISNIISEEDIKALSEWIATNPRLSKGPLTLEFEKKWAEWMGVKHAVFVNSGSSALLLMIYSLICSGRLKRGDKVAVPALSWSTDIAPLIQFGLEPVLIDCDSDNLCIDIDHFEKVVKENDIKAFILVYVLGLVPNVGRIRDICWDNNIEFLEDCCEAMGSQYDDHLVGSMGLMSTFSMFFSHHISTVEGGMICTNDDSYYQILLSIRAHGWTRDMANVDSFFEDYIDNHSEDEEVRDFNNSFKFLYPGFNVRSTDIQAFIGLRQMEKIDDIFKKRADLFSLWNAYYNDWKPKSIGFTSLFAIPVLAPSYEKRNKLIKELKREGIECRPIIAGSMSRQPFFLERYGYVEDVPNAEKVDSLGIFLPCHMEMNEDDIVRLAHIVEECFGD